MDIETIRGEFLRLSAEYPELFHAIVERTDDSFEMRKDMDVDQERAQQIFARRGFDVLGINFFLSSPRAHILTLWHGEPGEIRATRAEEEFIRLADLAEVNYRCEQFPLVHEQRARARVRCSDYGFDRKTGVAFDPGDRSGAGLHEWVGHIVVTAGVPPERPTVLDRDRKPLAEYLSHLLPINSFLASASALGSSATDQENDPPKGKPAAAGDGGEQPARESGEDDEHAGKKSSRKGKWVLVHDYLDQDSQGGDDWNTAKKQKFVNRFNSDCSKSPLYNHLTLDKLSELIRERRKTRNNDED